jgi:hypothetical protein
VTTFTLASRIAVDTESYRLNQFPAEADSETTVRCESDRLLLPGGCGGAKQQYGDRPN